MLKILVGDLFASKMETLVNTVNCVGVMGKGVAKIFKEKYPAMFTEYKIQCSQGLIKTGTLYPYYEDGNVRVLNFPTKVHWRSPSQISFIEDGLKWFVDHYEELGITSIAFPPLGCGNGGLKWENVGPIMVKALENLPIDIEIYAPFGTTKEKLQMYYLTHNHDNVRKSGIIYQQVNKNWLLVLQCIKKLQESQRSIKIGRTIFQKICFVLTRYGTDLGLRFTKGTYGPYSPDIKNMITILSNNNYIVEKEYGKMMLIIVNKDFKIDPTLYTEKEKRALH